MDWVGPEANGAEADAAAASSMQLVPASGGSLQSASARSRQRSRCSSPLFGTMAHGGSQLRSVNGHNRASLGTFTLKQSAVCRMCGDELAAEDDQDDFSPCDCTFQMCTVCLEHVRSYEKNRCPGCNSDLRTKEQWRAMKSFLCTEDTPTAVPNGIGIAPSFPDIGAKDQDLQLVKGSQDPAGVEVIACENSSKLPVASTAHYGFGSIAWHHPPCKANARGNPSADIKLRGLFRKSSYPASKIGPYRIFVFLRFCATVGFIQYRVTHPTSSGYWLWFLSVTCEIWLAHDCLEARYDNGQKDLPKVDVFVTTADAQKESPFVTACTVLSVMSADYPANKLACYLSDDGSSMLTFNVMAEVAGFARLWVPFCKSFDIEPRNPEAYFAHKFDFLKDKIQSDFVRSRRKVKKEFEEFKVRVNRLVADSCHPPAEGWQMKDGSPWPGNNYLNHDGIIQVFLHPDGDVMDVEGQHLPPLIYVSREKRPGHDHNKKAGAINALIRASGLITNGPYLINLDCDHYINNSQAIREALCFFLDPIKGRNIGFVQFPQRFDGVDQNDRYANHNTVFFDINMKGLDGLQGPVYVGTGCMFRRRKELPPAKLGMCSNFIESAMREENGQKSPFGILRLAHLLTALEQAVAHIASKLILTVVHLHGSPHSMLSDVVLSISCDYEDKTDWGTEVGWIYGSLTEDIVTGLRIHSCGWRSAYCDPSLAAFKACGQSLYLSGCIVPGKECSQVLQASLKGYLEPRKSIIGSAPLNMADRLHQVERWATGAVEIFFSGRNPLIYDWHGHLSFCQRLAAFKNQQITVHAQSRAMLKSCTLRYFNNAFYPFTSLAIVVYCLLPPLALLTDLFFIPPASRIKPARASRRRLWTPTTSGPVGHRSMWVSALRTEATLTLSYSNQAGRGQAQEQLEKRPECFRADFESVVDCVCGGQLAAADPMAGAAGGGAGGGPGFGRGGGGGGGALDLQRKQSPNFLACQSLDHYGVVCFTTLICSFLILSLLELRWSGVSFEAWWRNEQFWVIAGLTSHLAALVQGLLKVFAGIEIAFTVTSKGANSPEKYVDELHTFQFSWLLLPAVIVGLLNILGVVIGFARAFNTTSATHDWGQLLGKLAFSLWVLVHLYPFGKGLLGRREKVPTIVLVWAVLLTITTTLLWASFAPQTSTPTGWEIIQHPLDFNKQLPTESVTGSYYDAVHGTGLQR
eukprot:SM000046S16370  [mRNA]  locus=s46:176608:188879:+ [translate_table: standard]